MECLCPRCSACTKPIALGQEIIARDKFFHPGCFSCVRCGERDFQSTKFILSYGLLYCGRCFEQDMRHVPRCYGCKRLVLPEQPALEFYFQLTKATVHTPACAVCCVCGAQLTAETAAAAQGRLVCRTCFVECQ
jgi:hypothetical protein